jgi:hypothetical protein
MKMKYEPGKRICDDCLDETEWFDFEDWMQKAMHPETGMFLADNKKGQVEWIPVELTTISDVDFLNHVLLRRARFVRTVEGDAWHQATTEEAKEFYETVVVPHCRESISRACMMAAHNKYAAELETTGEMSATGMGKVTFYYLEMMNSFGLL